MDIQIIMGPGNSAAQLVLAPGETAVTEGGAMIAMSADTAIETTTHTRGGGGIMKGLKRMLTGESFFINKFTAGSQGAHVWVAATLAGDMTTLELEGSRWVVQSGAFVAAESTVQMDMSWQGFKTLFAKEGLFWINMSGSGKMVINSFGAIYPIDIDGEYIVDTGHIVAFEETLDFKLSKAGGSWVSSFLGGEGLVCRFTGKGRVWCQSHNASSFGRILGPKLRPR